MNRFTRRTVVAGAGAALMIPRLARAQTKIPTIGWLTTVTPAAGARLIASFRSGLAEAGLKEGADITIEERYAGGDASHLAELAKQLVDDGAAVIVTVAAGPALAAKAATQKIPIVFTNASYAVEQGIVPDLSHPGGNVTGIVQFNAGLEVKRLLLLAEVVPAATALVYPRNHNSPNVPFVDQAMVDAAKSVHRAFLNPPGERPEDVLAIFPMAAKREGCAVMIPAGPYFTTLYDKCAALAAQYKIPTLYGDRSAVPAGGLMSYGPIEDGARLAGSSFVPRILNGEKPGDIPVHQPEKFELLLNMKAAANLGLTFPSSILDKATEKVAG